MKFFNLSLAKLTPINKELVPTEYCYSIIMHFEGLGPRGIVKVGNVEKCFPYICPAGVPTIGWGRTLSWDEYRRLKTTGITIEQAKKNLQEDVSRFAAGVKKLISVPVQDYQFDALVSFSYNVGINNFKSSTLRRKLNKKDYTGASKEFCKWIYSKKKPLPGLVTRREAERRMFVNDPPRSKASYMLFLMTA